MECCCQLNSFWHTNVGHAQLLIQACKMLVLLMMLHWLVGIAISLKVISPALSVAIQGTTNYLLVCMLNHSKDFDSLNLQGQFHLTLCIYWYFERVSGRICKHSSQYQLAQQNHYLLLMGILSDISLLLSSTKIGWRHRQPSNSKTKCGLAALRLQIFLVMVSYDSWWRRMRRSVELFDSQGNVCNIS